MTRSVRALAAAALVAAVAALSACGGDPDASASGGSAAGAPDDEAQIAFARCMREGGIEIPDPGSGGGPQRLRLSRDIAPEKLRSTMEECRETTGGGPPERTEEQQAEMRDAMLEFARCMRAEGVDVPDPTGEGPGGGLRMQRRDVDSPAFRKAAEKCQDELPFGPGGPGGGAERGQ
jgi:hypothetical protein